MLLNDLFRPSLVILLRLKSFYLPKGKEIDHKKFVASFFCPMSSHSLNTDYAIVITHVMWVNEISFNDYHYQTEAPSSYQYTLRDRSSYLLD